MGIYTSITGFEQETALEFIQVMVPIFIGKELIGALEVTLLTLQALSIKLARERLVGMSMQTIVMTLDF